ncbi:MAG: serine O-acetyltransferase [Andreesenia angusta]|nr:serine O-acetyltransferase [Andreesenia angusta]
MRKIIQDIKAIKSRDPAVRSYLEAAICYPGLHAIFVHRINHWLYNRRLFFLSRIMSNIVRLITGVEIHPGAKIGRGVFIDHGMGVVIGETAEIGDNVTIYQGVTLGGTGKDTGKRHPTIRNNVVVSSGAKVLGPFTVGENSKIGAGAVVLKEVPPNCTVVGVPGRIVVKDNKKVYDKGGIEILEIPKGRRGIDLNQIDLPDPVFQEINKLKQTVLELQKEMEQLKEGEDKNETL